MYDYELHRTSSLEAYHPGKYYVQRGLRGTSLDEVGGPGSPLLYNWTRTLATLSKELL